MSIIGEGTIITKDNLNRFLPSLARQLYESEATYCFFTESGEGNYLLAIDLDKDTDFPFITNINNVLRGENSIVITSEIPYETDTEYINNNLFILNGETFVVGKNHRFLYDVIKGKNRLKSTSIDDLELSVRSYNVLHNAKITTVKQLIDCTEEDLFKIRNMGKKSVYEIKNRLENLGLTLKEEEL